MPENVHHLALPPGHRLGKYELGETLGSGGFGITYLARDLEDSRSVAIKELLPTCMVTRRGTRVITNHSSENGQWEWAQQRFRDEAETLLQCDHPNVLKVYCTFPANGTVYMVTRYEDGCDMEKWLRRIQGSGRAVSEDDLRFVLLPALSALERVHQIGYLHRDLKTENIYITRDGRPVLLDFGSARQLVFRGTVPVTMILTPGYAPVEQYGNVIKQGAWTDLYSLGAVLYRSITNKIPPAATDRSAPGVVDPCLRLAETYAGRYSPVLLQSIDTALSIHPQDRLQTATAWRHLLARETVPAVEEPRPPKTKREITHLRPPEPPREEPRRQPVAIPQKARSGIEIPAPPLPRNPDLHGAVQIDGRTARKGGRVKVTLEGITIAVPVPPQTRDGQIIHLRGQGHPASGTAKAGDAFIRIFVRSDGKPEQPAATESNSIAWWSLFLPGMGRLPEAALLPAMLYLLATGGAYVLGFACFSADNLPATGITFGIAVVFHLGAVWAAFHRRPSQQAFHILPKAGAGWWAFAGLLLLFAAEIVALTQLNSF